MVEYVAAVRAVQLATKSAQWARSYLATVRGHFLAAALAASHRWHVRQGLRGVPFGSALGITISEALEVMPDTGCHVRRLCRELKLGLGKPSKSLLGAVGYKRPAFLFTCDLCWTGAIARDRNISVDALVTCDFAGATRALAPDRRPNIADVIRMALAHSSTAE